MKIVLISLYDKIALGVRSLSSYLKAHGHNTSIIYFKNYSQFKCEEIKNTPSLDLHIQIKEDGRYALGYPAPPTSEEYSALINLLKELKPDLIGISLTYLHRNIAREISKKIKTNYHIPIIWGGVEPTIEPEISLEYSDMVLRGEGEGAMLELADRMDKKLDISNIPNIWTKSRDNIIKNPIRQLIKDLDSLPFIDTVPENKYSINANKIYKNESGLSNDPFREKYEIMTNRGCPYRCTYCANHQLRKLYNGSPYLRQRSVANVIAEIEEAKKKRLIEFIEFQDDIFPWNRDWVKEFSSIYREKIGVPFCCYLHPDHVERENIKALRDGGLRHVVIGLQSGSRHILYDIFRRPTSSKKIVDGAKKLRQENIFTYFDVITENAFEEDADRRETLSVLLKIPAPFGINLSRLSFFPGTEINEMAKSEKIGVYTDGKASRFWSTLYLLTAQRYFPRPIILLLSRLKFLKNNPKHLDTILKLYSRMKNIKKVFAWKRQA